MTVKLTLTIDKDVVVAAKRYAANNNTELSDIIGGYLRSLATSGQEGLNRLSCIESLGGSIQLPGDFDYKKELSKAMAKRYS